MQVRVITMRYHEGLQGFPEDVLQKATFGRTVLDVSEHFFLHGNIPHLALVLKLAEKNETMYENVASFRPHDISMSNPEETMSDAQIAVYRALKAWRNEMRKIEGRPAYAIARNAQLAALVKTAPKSVAAIKGIAGLGEGFCKKYGEKVLELLSEVRAETPMRTLDGTGTDEPSTIATDDSRVAQKGVSTEGIVQEELSNL